MESSHSDEGTGTRAPTLQPFLMFRASPTKYTFCYSASFTCFNSRVALQPDSNPRHDISEGVNLKEASKVMFLPFVCVREQQKNSIKRHGRQNRLHYFNLALSVMFLCLFPAVLLGLKQKTSFFVRELSRKWFRAPTKVPKTNHQ